MKKTIAIILALALLFCTTAFAGCGKKGGSGGEDSGSSNVSGKGVSADTAVGDKITMGKFDGKALEWTAAGKGVGTVLLISDKVIDRRAFNEEDNRAAKWEGSSIRAYLNGEFYDSVFSEDEKALIATTELKTYTFDFDTYQTNAEYTEDNVFLLSGEEFARYVTKITDLRFGIPTQALLDDDIYMADVEGSDTVKQACGWILRDDGEQESSNILEVYGYDGSVSLYGNEKTNQSGIRPAMWVYTDKALAEGWENGTAELPADEALDAKLAGLSVGAALSFGEAAYRDPSLGMQELTWKVLDETEDAWLIYSDSMLGAYNLGEADDETVTWATSYARSYINSREFKDSFFTPWEQAKIRLSHISTCGSASGWDVDPGPETDDYLFLLDREEIEKYYPNEADRVVPEGSYWLRSPDFVKGWFSYVNEIGGIGQNDAPHYCGLRIAMWISK